jgi:adenylate kinase family enzyme
MNRVLVVGTTGSGKTTTAARMAEILKAPHVELDSLFWKPNWTMSEPDEFKARIAEATPGDRWILDGNYLNILGDYLWERADTVIWLDMPLPLLIRRLVRRTIKRSLLRTKLWAGNKEQLSNLWNKEEGLINWARQTHESRREEYGRRLTDPRWTNIRFVHLRSPREARSWLRGEASKYEVSER